MAALTPLNIDADNGAFDWTVCFDEPAGAFEIDAVDLWLLPDQPVRDRARLSAPAGKPPWPIEIADCNDDNPDAFAEGLIEALCAGLKHFPPPPDVRAELTRDLTQWVLEQRANATAALDD